MRVAINALPINNFSGRNVVVGHVSQWQRACGDRHRFVVIHHRGNRHLREALGDAFDWFEVEGLGVDWRSRLAWEVARLPGILRRLRAELLLSTSGALSPRVPVPQWVLAQNPWCFFPRFHRDSLDKLKAALQRRGYRRAQREADAMFYLSDFLRSLYESDADRPPRAGRTVYVGVDDKLFEEGAQRAVAFEERRPEVVALSVMARHKAIEDVVEAIALARYEVAEICLTLVGPWPDASYRSEIEALIATRRLGDCVEITGEVDDTALRQHMRRARAFCLLSRCESFGIPAIEAQTQGTPTLVADVCAPPEVAGPGGAVVTPGDASSAAEILVAWITNEAAWSEASERARRNAERFRWEQVSQPLIEYFEQWLSGR